MNVNYVVEGSVRRSADRVRVSVSLTNTAAGSLLWSERYDTELGDLFAVQEEIARKISGALAVRVSGLEAERAASKPPDNLEAYDLVLRGRDLLSNVKRSDNAQARTLFERAIELDPGYAPAHVGLGHVHLTAVAQGWTPDPSGTLERAEDLARKAIGLDDLAPGAHALLGNTVAYFGEYDRAIEHLRRAIDLNSSDAEGYRGLVSVLLWTGDTKDAIAAGEFLAQLQPNLSVTEAFHLATAYLLADRSTDAIRVLEQALSGSGTNPAANAVLAAAYAEIGQQDEAERQAEIVRRLYPVFPRDEFGSALRDQSQREKLDQALRRAGL